ncbi:MAG: phage major capsid protein [Betaproteobacteria bacterium]|nr:MAG: phage major capsid protein [Betaproteobacteria bacterium]
MPFTSQEITDAGKIGLDFYLKNEPIDQVAVERPLFKYLAGKKVSAPGAKQYIVEQLRVRYQSNFQWFNGSQVVTYNRRQSIEPAQYAWRSAHDGFSLDEDRLIQNGITVDDNGPGGNASDAERLQLTNLLKEQTEILKLGFQEKFSQAQHLDGTQSSDAITGVDALISLTPTTGTVGGIDRAGATNVYWRNYAQTGLTTTTTTGNILDYMEIAWRACVRNGGKPDFIEAGDDFIDGFRNFMFKSFGRLDYEGVSERTIEGGTKMLTFHGVTIVWNPEFDDLDSLYAPATAWSKRCYMLNGRHVKLRPIEGQDMITRKPPRAYDKYEYYWGLTWRGAMTMNRSNAHAVVSIA